MSESNYKSKAGAVYLLFLCYALFSSIVGQLIPFLRSEYGITMTEAGLFSTLQSTGGMIAVLAGMFLLDVFNKPKVLGLAALVFAISAGAVGFGWGFPFVLAAFFTAGAAACTVDTLGNAVISDNTAHAKGFYLGLTHAFYGVGGVAGPFLAVFLSGAAGGNAAFIVLGAIVLACAIFYMIAYGKEMREPALPEKRHFKQNFKDIFLLLKGRAMREVFIAAFFIVIFEVSVVYWSPSYFSEAGGGEAYGAIALTVFFAAMTLGRFAGSVLAKKLKPYMFVSFLSFATFAFSAAAFLIKDYGVSVTFLALGAFVYGSIFPQIIVQSCLLAPENSAMASGLVIMGATAAAFFAPLVIGAIGDAAGLQAGLLFCSACALPVGFLGLQFRKSIS